MHAIKPAKTIQSLFSGMTCSSALHDACCGAALASGSATTVSCVCGRFSSIGTTGSACGCAHQGTGGRRIRQGQVRDEAQRRTGANSHQTGPASLGPDITFLNACEESVVSKGPADILPRCRTVHPAASAHRTITLMITAFLSGFDLSTSISVCSSLSLPHALQTILKSRPAPHLRFRQRQRCREHCRQLSIAGRSAGFGASPELSKSSR